MEMPKVERVYHAGLWLRFKLPMVGWYIRPELVYTSLKSEVELRTAATTAGYNFQKIDIPVLIGKKFFKSRLCSYRTFISIFT